MSLVSVIVPVYNAQKYLKKCLDSLVNQTLKDIEIILVDDGSTDSSLDICTEYAKNYPAIKILTQKNQGPSIARNNALKIASGKYIGFVDSDDFIEKETYELAVKAMEENPHINLVIWGVKVTSEDDLPYIEWFQNNYFNIKNEGLKKVNDDILFDTAVVPWNKLYRSSVIKEHDIIFPEGKLYEDNAFWWKYIAWCEDVFFIKKHLHCYNMRAVSLRGEVIHKNSEREADRIYMVEDVYDFYLKNNLLDENNKRILDLLFFNSFTDAYKETTDKLLITLISKKLVGKMDLKNSSLENVKDFAEHLEQKCEQLDVLNKELDLKTIFKNKDFSEYSIEDAVSCVRNDVAYFADDDNIKNDIFLAHQKLHNANEAMSTLIKDYMTTLSLSDEYTYLSNFFLAFPRVEEMNNDVEVAEIITTFLSDLYKKQKADEIIKFGQIILMLYPNSYETMRILGDTYLFLENKPQIAFSYYQKYTEIIKNNESVLNVMADICGQYGDVFNQLMYKQMACQLLNKSN